MFAPIAARQHLRWFAKNDLYFLMTQQLRRPDRKTQWDFLRCNEVQDNPDGFMDMWTRGAGKSTIISWALPIQDALNYPNESTAWFSHTRPISRTFIKLVKTELEDNIELINLHPEILWSVPKNESPKWSELEGLIGCFSNTLVLRSSFAGNPNFRESLRRMKEVALGAFSHADVPFEKLVEELKPERVPNRMLLFQVNFRLLTGPLPPINFPGLTSNFLRIDNHMAKFDIAAELRANPDGLGGYIEYFTDLFDAFDLRKLLAELF
jgi:hypothetical protein